MWKALRITVLLLVLLAVALHTWLDRVATQGWQEPLWVGLFPLNGDGSASTGEYLSTLRSSDFQALENFFARESTRYGLKLDQPVHVELYPQGSKLPPALAPDAGPLGTAWWSLKLRWFAAHAAQVPGRAPPRVRLFLLYHDPDKLERTPDSHGMQKGLVGVVHLFADSGMAGQNNIVIAHELLHTVGATDKYDLNTGAPLFPGGYADREQEPRYPQQQAEVMAGRRPLSAYQWEMPHSLAGVVVGPETAREIRWTH
ncbi:MAG: hypothetical protein JO184_05455 [Gammaproteobacteria bacterium]|nr:hypothetical protein [Gammaproteobacteria bacterium]MBV8307575.1 hypothetical protein [Gammaproteobacteria bacterium]MBV8403246.1 hypothetical protein [Gammaproteobacteria bacterium]